MSNKKTSIFILAGEPSADNIGADLVKELSLKGDFIFSGVGGEKLQNQGLKSIFKMSDLSVMGFYDVILSLPLIFWRLNQTTKYILKSQPDIIILIDSQVFSAMLAKRLRKRGYQKPILLYVAPSVWAWKPERAKNLVGIFDEILAVLPFEVEVMKQLKGPKTTYVGHSALKNINPIEHSNDLKKTVIALYPGSRKGEIKRHLTIFKQLAKKLIAQENVSSFILPTLPHLHNDLEKYVKEWNVPIKVISDEKEKAKALKAVKLAVATAGTITLELALYNILMVATYVPDRLQLMHYYKAGKPRIALPNIIMDEEIIAEIFPDDQLIENLFKLINELIENKEKSQEQFSSFSKLRALLKNGDKATGRHDPATRILAHLNFSSTKNNS